MPNMVTPVSLHSMAAVDRQTATDRQTADMTGDWSFIWIHLKKLNMSIRHLNVIVYTCNKNCTKSI